MKKTREIELQTWEEGCSRWDVGPVWQVVGFPKHAKRTGWSGTVVGLSSTVSWALQSWLCLQEVMTWAFSGWWTGLNSP